ncbi:Coatomer subunit zeta-2 [Cymbomonas tetramitiformis]|uniref:Coatomer subunit zeta n=1 Tax=Cymbomonas tetramitiformis TaxID=36881 RepID=A0AAE0GEF0_9CHLO|nr:Coatomer subunit zeta-2 [Cymbomonas tetramitiformis]
METSCPLIKNILILDGEGKRIAVKYYGNEWATPGAQATFEKSVFSKTQRTNARGEAEIIMFDNVITVFKFVSDLHFYVTGNQDENELILVTVLQALFDAISLLLRNAVEKKTVLENLDLVLLTLDEIVDGGVILETEASVIASRVTMRGADSDLPLSEQTFTQALASAKEQIARSLLN